MRLRMTISFITVLLAFIILYLLANTVGNRDFFSTLKNAEERPILSSALLCLDNPIAKFVLTDLRIADRPDDSTVVVSGHTILGWRVVTIKLTGAEATNFTSCEVTW